MPSDATTDDTIMNAVDDQHDPPVNDVIETGEDGGLGANGEYSKNFLIILLWE